MGQRKYRNTRKEQMQEYAHRYYEIHKDQMQEDHRRWHESHKKQGRGYWLKFKFSMTREEYEAMLSQQDGKCAICGIPSALFNRGLAVDHNHKTKKIRALLCHNCNTMLGHSFDDPEILRAAAKYLEKSSEPGRG
jgi:hypothetical protein